MKLFNNDFKAAMKGYKALKTVCKSFMVRNGHIVIQSSDVELTVVIDGVNNDNIVLDNETLAIMSKCNDDDFIITLDSVTAGDKTITYENTSYTYTPIDYGSYKEIATTTQKELLEAIKGVKHSVGKDEARPVLSNILWDGDKLVTIDGYRITTKTIPCDIKVAILIPNVAYTLLEKLLNAKSKDLVKVYHSEHEFVSFDFGDWLLTFKLVAGEYMNYKSLFETDFKTICSVDRIQLLNSLVFLSKHKVPVKLGVSHGELALSVNTESNKITDKVYTKQYVYSRPFDIFFNSTYLIESLKNIKDADVVLKFAGASLSPLLIAHSKGQDLILPIRG